MARDTARAEIEIASPLKKVFYFTSNLRNLPYWGEVEEIKVVEEKPSRVGSEYIAIEKTFFSTNEIPLEVVAFKSPRNFTFRDKTKNSDYEYTFFKTETGTRIILLNRVEENSRKLERLLVNLKNHLEASEG